MAGFFKKIWKAGGWLKGWVRDFRVPGIGVHVMTDAALAERIKTAERAERSKSNRLVGGLLHDNAVKGAENTLMKHRLKKVR